METLKFIMVTTHLPPHHLGGDAVFVDYLSRELASLGHEVHAFTFPGAYSVLRGGRCHPETLKGDSGHVTEHMFSPLSSKMAVLGSLMTGGSGRAKTELNSLVRCLKADVVHWHNTKGFIGMPYQAGEAANVYTAHDCYAICPRSNLLRPDLSVCDGPYTCLSCHLRWRKPPPIWRVGSRRVLAFDDRMKLISPSDFLARKLGEHGIHVQHVINNFVPRSATVRNDDDRSRNAIVYAGMLEPHKGVVTLLKGFSESRNLHGFRLTIVGDGSSRGDLARLIEELGLRDRVELTGFVSRERLNQIRDAAAFQVIPSEWMENAPLTAIEALSSGTPIIASDQGGLPEIIGTGEDKLVFKARDVQSLADTLVRAWGSIDTLEELRRRAVKSYADKYLPETHLRKYLEVVRG